MRRIVMFSGGIMSWACARRVVEKHGAAEVTLLFADTKWEDEDVYRFIREAAVNVGAPLVTVCDGRTIWEVFRDERVIGNTRMDPCSKILKRQQLDRWLVSNCDPADTICYVGIGHQESVRFFGRPDKPALQQRMKEKGWCYEAPLCMPPYLANYEILAWCDREGLAPPSCYEEGFSHANCQGACVKAGMAQWRLLLETRPQVFEEASRKEQEMRAFLGKDVAILRDRRGGQTRPLPLAEFKQRYQATGECDRQDWGGCSCFAGSDEE